VCSVGSRRSSAARTATVFPVPDPIAGMTPDPVARPRHHPILATASPWCGVAVHHAGASGRGRTGVAGDPNNPCSPVDHDATTAVVDRAGVSPRSVSASRSRDRAVPFGLPWGRRGARS